MRLLKKISPEWLFLALLAALLLAVVLLIPNHSYWAILPAVVAIGMVLALLWDNRTEPIPWGRVLWFGFVAILLTAGALAYFGHYYWALAVGVVAFVYGSMLAYLDGDEFGY